MVYDQIETAETLTQVPPCPLCHQADQVQKMETAYDRGGVRFHRPSLPPNVKALLPLVGLAVLLDGGAHLFLLSQMGGRIGFEGWPLSLQVFEVVVLLVILIIGLALSIPAFGCLINTRQETIWRYSAGNRAITRLHNLYYCQQDHVAFDARQQVVRSPADMEHFIHILPPDSAHPAVEDRME